NHVPNLCVPMCQVYNDWLYEYCQVDATQLKGVALLPLQDSAEAARELRRAARELRFVAGLMIPNPVIGRRLRAGAYDVLYREAETLGVPIVVSHGGSGMALPQVGQDRWPVFYAQVVRPRRNCSSPSRWIRPWSCTDSRIAGVL